MTLPTTTIETLTVLLILLPGFLCARIVQAHCVRAEQSSIDKVIEAVIYSFLIYVAFATTIGPFDLKNSKHLLIIALYSLLAGVLFVAAINSDFWGRIFRRYRITQRTSKPSVWNDVFHGLGGYVLVELSDGRLVSGWLRYFSDREEAPSLFLEDAAWVDSVKGTEIPIAGPGILLTRHREILSVAFLTPRKVDSRVEEDRALKVASGQ